LARTSLKRAAITRTAFEYQDLIGIDILINFFRDPKLYQWVELESENREAGYLDDIVAARTNGDFEYIQVKFTVDPNKYLLDWEWLLERKAHGTSRLKKWATSLSRLTKFGAVHLAELRTNRRPNAEFQGALDQDRIQLNRLSANRREAVEKEVGGPKQAKAFFEAFIFRHSETPDAEGLERRLKAKVIPTDTTIEGWLLLRAQVRRWATHKSQPEPDGKVRHQHLVQIISKKRPRPIPQNFVVPSVYAIPDLRFHDDFLKRIIKGRAAISVLWERRHYGFSIGVRYLVRFLILVNQKKLAARYCETLVICRLCRDSRKEHRLSLHAAVGLRVAKPDECDWEPAFWISVLFYRLKASTFRHHGAVQSDTVRCVPIGLFANACVRRVPGNVARGRCLPLVALPSS